MAASDREEYEKISPHPLSVDYLLLATIAGLFIAYMAGNLAGKKTVLTIVGLVLLWIPLKNYLPWVIKYRIKEKYQLLTAGALPLIIFFAMMIPFVNGWTSLTESSAIGAMTAFITAVFKGRMSWPVMEKSVRSTLAISCMFMFIIVAAMGFGAVFDGLGAVHAISNLFTEKLGLSPWMILILMQLSFLVMGTFLDDTAMLVIVAPLYIPLVQTLGFDLIWYGVLYTITTQIAYMTPPFGYNLFLMRAMAPPEINMRDIYASIFPFVAVMVVALALIMLFPQIALWLPHYIYFGG